MINRKTIQQKIFKKSTLITAFSAIIGSLVLSACATTSEDLGFHVTSTSMNDNHIFNEKVSLGSNVSPQLTWSKNPKAQGYAILMIDKDAAGTIGVPFAHWFAVVKDANTTSMPEGASNLWSATSSPMKDKFFQFENMTTKSITSSVIPTSFQRDNAKTYFGPMPPDRDHLYEIQVIALENPQAFPTDNKTNFVDFQQYVAQSKPAGIASLFGVGRQVKNGGSDQKTLMFANDPAKTIHNGQFYKTLAAASKKIAEFKAPGLVTEAGKPPLLPDEYVSMLSNTGTSAAVEKANNRVVKRQADTENTASSTAPSSSTSAKFSATNSPELTWNRYEGAKSYALFLNNSNQYEKWGAPVVNWVVWNIEQPVSGTTVTLAKGASSDTSSKIKQGWNSYNPGTLGWGKFTVLNTLKVTNGSSTTAPAASSVNNGEEQKSEVAGEFLQQATGLGEKYFVPFHQGITHHKGFYSFFLYALDVEGSQLSSSIKTQQDLMQAMNGHVLAIAQLNFKLQKTAPTTSAKSTS